MRTRNMFLAGTALTTCVGFATVGALQLESQSQAATPELTEEVLAATPGSKSRWGANYFPNVPLITHEGKTVRFFDDLIADKVVMINFIYTSCPDSCPLETARIAEVAEVLGERVGKDVFIYSITIDPKNDTPEVLKQYAQRYKAGSGWSFLTGKEADITALRKKLGLYIPEIQKDESNNHNLSLIIGNQATGRWMKRSPFENPHVLAKQVGSWLHNWKQPSKTNNDFANAPKLRSLSDGERLFRTRCAACHTIGGNAVGGTVATDRQTMGPDLLGVTERRDPQWLARWIAEPDKMLAEKDPIAMGLFEQYNSVPMPNMRLGSEDVAFLIDFLDSEIARQAEASAHDQSRDGLLAKGPWIREAHPDAKVNAGYMSLANQGKEERVLVALESPAYERVELHEMNMAQGMKGMRAIPELRLPAGETVVLKPGGKHLMLIGPKKPLKTGDKIRLTLIFKSGKRWPISVPVRK